MIRVWVCVIVFAPLVASVAFSSTAAAQQSNDPYICSSGPNATTVDRVEVIDPIQRIDTVVGTAIICSPLPEPCPVYVAVTENNGAEFIICGAEVRYSCQFADGRWYRAWFSVNLTAAGEFIGWNEHYQTLDPGVYPARAEAGSLYELTTLPGFEDIDADVLRLYWAFFLRDGDLAGSKYWLRTIDETSLDAIADSFALSAEFALRYGDTTDREFVEIVYDNVLGRNFDQAGFDYWLGLLESGELTRGGVVRWVAANAEFENAHPYPSGSSADAYPSPLFAHPDCAT